jgi:hypothetical protein
VPYKNEKLRPVYAVLRRGRRGMIKDNDGGGEFD